jgi:hypothetical protein
MKAEMYNECRNANEIKDAKSKDWRMTHIVMHLHCTFVIWD